MKKKRAINIFIGVLLIISIYFAGNISVFATTSENDFASNEISKEGTLSNAKRLSKFKYK